MVVLLILILNLVLHQMLLFKKNEKKNCNCIYNWKTAQESAGKAPSYRPSPAARGGAAAAFDSCGKSRQRAACITARCICRPFCGLSPAQALQG